MVLNEKIRTGEKATQPIRIGTAGWNIPRAYGIHFPSEGSHLERYSRILNASEINSSFYRHHKKETWERWAASVPQEFRFSVKAPRTITHDAGLNCPPEVLTAFFEQVYFLQEKLGAILFQLPPSLEFQESVANRFLTLLRANYSGDVAWEPRHSSWFEERVDEVLKDFKIARVAADPACVPIAARPGWVPTLVYFRLHGSPRRYYSSYSEDFLKALADETNLLIENCKSLVHIRQHRVWISHLERLGVDATPS